MLRRLPEAAVPGGDLGTARFETFLRRLFGVKGQVAPAVEPKLSAGLDLLRPPWELGEAALLMGWRGYQTFYQVTAVAAQYGFVVLDNPTASGAIALVQEVSLYPAGANYGVSVDVAPGTVFTGGAVVASKARRDSRIVQVANQASSCIVRQGTGATVPPYDSYTLYMAGGVISASGPWIIAPGSQLCIVCRNANIEIRPQLVWWERAAEPSELSAR